ncbi:MAG: galactokinase [Anaerolineaceae bacterium 4572_78]|nr:MAG: galactokinase [Anaerolineaceae bacterium 4572_78]
MHLTKKITKQFRVRFHSHPTLIVRAPGRVNLIGEHTDYNDGFVLPMAINRSTWIALCPRDDEKVITYSLNRSERVKFSLQKKLNHRGVRWGEYIKGMTWALQNAEYELKGWNGFIGGDIPIGAGLSSSAALELATAKAFSEVSGFEWDGTEIAKLAQQAENKWIGLSCGIMDQLISAIGVENHALLIDCRSLETQAIPLPPDTTIVVLDTTKRRGLVTSAYNERRLQCEAAAKLFDVPALRDVSLEEFETKVHQLDELTARRAKHVITENARTLQAVEAMKNSDAKTLGQLMNESHDSLRDDFEVTVDELNIMVDCARKQEGCYGAKMTGGGFGGCAIALVQANVARQFAKNMAACYRISTGLIPKTYLCRATNGAEVVNYPPA